MTPDRLLDVSTVARLIGVSDETVRVWIRQQQVEAQRIGGRYKIRSSELARLRENFQKSQPRAEKRL